VEVRQGRLGSLRDDLLQQRSGLILGTPTARNVVAHDLQLGAEAHGPRLHVARSKSDEMLTVCDDKVVRDERRWSIALEEISTLDE